MTHIIARTLTQTRALVALRHPTRRITSTANPSCLFCRLLRLVFCQALLQIGRRLKLGFLGCTSAPSGSKVACGSPALSFSLGELLQDALIVALGDVVRNTLHAEDLDIQA